MIHTIARELNNAPHKLKLHLVEGDSTTELRKELFNTSIADLGLLTHQRILVEKETQINEAMISASYGSRMATPSYTRLDNRAGKPIQRGALALSLSFSRFAWLCALTRVRTQASLVFAILVTRAS